MTRTVSFVTALAVGVGLAAVMFFQQTPATADDHAATEPGLPAAPEFTLADTTGTQHSLSDFRGKHVVLEWFNPGCPFVVKFYKSGKMQELQREYTDKGVVWLTVTSTNPDHKDYLNAQGLKDKYDQWDMASTAILRDDNGAVGRAYEAATTPHMYIINPDGKLIYHGAIDSKVSTNPDHIESATNYVQMVLDANLLESTQPYGCSVKY